eukprot:527481_1
MSLKQAVAFRDLISQLTHDECVGFLSKLVHSQMDMIVTSLFDHFAKTNHATQVNAVNQSLSDIIESRKPKLKTISTANMSLSQLPTAIIGHTASFLTQRNYFDLSASNRSIYLGCYSPNLLHELQLSELDYSSINLQLFPSVKTLNIDPLDVMQSPHSLILNSPMFT